MIHIVSRTGLFLAIVCTMLSCNQQQSMIPPDAGMAAFNKDTLAADIKILASDDFQGRRPFTPGETKTINYLVNAYTGLGLEPDERGRGRPGVGAEEDHAALGRQRARAGGGADPVSGIAWMIAR